MSSEITRLRAYAKRTAAEFQRARIPLEGPLVTTYRNVVRREGFLGMRMVSTREPGPEVPELIGWLLWSHVYQKAEHWESSGNPRRPRGPRLEHTWTITRNGLQRHPVNSLPEPSQEFRRPGSEFLNQLQADYGEWFPEQRKAGRDCLSSRLIDKKRVDMGKGRE